MREAHGGWRATRYKRHCIRQSRASRSDARSIHRRNPAGSSPGEPDDNRSRDRLWFAGDLVNRAQALPGVVSVALTSAFPLGELQREAERQQSAKGKGTGDRKTLVSGAEIIRIAFVRRKTTGSFPRVKSAGT